MPKVHVYTCQKKCWNWETITPEFTQILLTTDTIQFVEVCVTSYLADLSSDLIIEQVLMKALKS